MYFLKMFSNGNCITTCSKLVLEPKQSFFKKLGMPSCSLYPMCLSLPQVVKNFEKTFVEIFYFLEMLSKRNCPGVAPIVPDFESKGLESETI